MVVNATETFWLCFCVTRRRRNRLKNNNEEEMNEGLVNEREMNGIDF
jgi:hypothetical protein